MWFVSAKKEESVIIYPEYFLLQVLRIPGIFYPKLPPKKYNYKNLSTFSFPFN